MKKQARITNMRLLMDILSVKRPSQDKSTYQWMRDFMNQECPSANHDIYNNYWLEIKQLDGEAPTVAFTSHYDTVHKTPGKLTLKRNGDILTALDNGQPSVLGADDGVGMFLMFEMIRHGIPGLYIFFSDEESGCIGSGSFNRDIVKNVHAMISFDRKGTNEVITHQCSSRCASELAGNWIAKQLGMGYKTSDLGAFTDSYEFADTIAECFNLSVGYYDQHTTRERLDLDHVNKLLSRLVAIDWDDMPVGRVPQPTYFASTATFSRGGYGSLAWNSTSANSGLYDLEQYVYDYPEKVAKFLESIGVDIFEIESSLEDDKELDGLGELDLSDIPF